MRILVRAVIAVVAAIAVHLGRGPKNWRKFLSQVQFIDIPTISDISLSIVEIPREIIADRR